jgi:DNA-directed RNA polymerase specialized sigma24 family protein
MEDEAYIDDLIRQGLLKSRRGRPSRAAVAAKLEAGVAELRSRMGGLLSPDEAQDIWGDIWEHEAHNSTALEGNTLAVKEVAELLKSGKAVGGKPLRDYLEVKGYADAAQWAYRQALQPGGWRNDDLLSLEEIRGIHFRVVDPVWTVFPPPGAGPEERPGSLRRHDIEPLASGVRPPSWVDVPHVVGDWIATLAEVSRADPLERLQSVAAVHGAFERIHPFYDGNGRTGRLVTNLILVRLGYPPAIIVKAERPKYIQALGRADQGDTAWLGEILARASTATLYRFMIPAAAGPHRNVPLAALADAEVTARALRNAAERGRLRATRGADGQWRSNAHAVSDYKSSRYRRRLRLTQAPKRGWGALALRVGVVYSTKSRRDLEQFLDDLAPRYRRVLQLRFGLFPGRQLDVSEIGARFGIQASRAQELIDQALALLQERVVFHRLNTR